jgi:hypothetical protein
LKLHSKPSGQTHSEMFLRYKTKGRDRLRIFHGDRYADLYLADPGM